MVVAALGALDVQRGNPDALLPGKVVHFFGGHGRGTVFVAGAQGARVGDQQDQTGGIVAPAQAFNGLVDAGKGIFVEVVAGNRGFLRFGKALLQSRAVFGRGKVADDAGGVIERRGCLRAAAEGDHGKADVVGHAVAFQLVVNGSDNVAALINVGLHGNGGVHDNGDARSGRAAGGGLRLRGVAGVNGRNLKELDALVGVLHLQNGHEIEALCRNSSLGFGRFAGHDGQIGGGGGLGRGKQLVEALFHVDGLTDVVETLFLLEEEDRITTGAGTEKQGQRLIPGRAPAGLNPAFGLLRAGADLKPSFGLSVDIQHGKGRQRAQRFAFLIGLCIQGCAGMADDTLEERLFSFLNERRGFRHIRKGKRKGGKADAEAEQGGGATESVKMAFVHQNILDRENGAREKLPRPRAYFQFCSSRRASSSPCRAFCSA